MEDIFESLRAVSFGSTKVDLVRSELPSVAQHQLTVENLDRLVRTCAFDSEKVDMVKIFCECRQTPLSTLDLVGILKRFGFDSGRVDCIRACIPFMSDFQTDRLCRTMGFDSSRQEVLNLAKSMLFAKKSASTEHKQETSAGRKKQEQEKRRREEAQAAEIVERWQLEQAKAEVERFERMCAENERRERERAEVVAAERERAENERRERERAENERHERERAEAVAVARVAELQVPEQRDEPLLQGDEPEGVACVVCLERRKTTACVDCGHACYCVACARAMKDEPVARQTCPVCRVRLTRIIHVFQ